MQNTLFYHLKKTASKNSLSFSRYSNFTKVKERFDRTVYHIFDIIDSDLVFPFANKALLSFVSDLISSNCLLPGVESMF